MIWGPEILHEVPAPQASGMLFLKNMYVGAGRPSAAHVIVTFIVLSRQGRDDMKLTTIAGTGKG